MNAHAELNSRNADPEIGCDELPLGSPVELLACRHDYALGGKDTRETAA